MIVYWQMFRNDVKQHFIVITNVSMHHIRRPLSIVPVGVPGNTEHWLANYLEGKTLKNDEKVVRI